ncbi:MAG: TIGR01620 family protein [Rhizobiaceae bacterium]|nr:TIGR01620 family protein [Rhizobiaceae bacterium]
MSDSNRKPRSFKITPEETEPKAQNAIKTQTTPKQARKPRTVKDLENLTLISDDEANGIIATLEPEPLASKKRSGFKWSNLFFMALGGLISIAIGLSLDQLIRELFERYTWAGWFAAVLTALLVLSLIAIVLKEIWGIFHLQKITDLRQKAALAKSDNNLSTAKRIIHELAGLFRDRPDMALARTSLAAHARELVDGSDLITLAERNLMEPLDIKARQLVMNSAKRVSLVTAISPRALIDIAYVLTENIRLVRALSQLYGGRPGTLGFLRLSKNVLTHLAATGAIAIGVGLLQQMIGQGLAAKLSARLGEGVINGLLTARIGISAMDICRPMAFDALSRPGISDFMGELLKLNQFRTKEKQA